MTRWIQKFQTSDWPRSLVAEKIKWMLLGLQVDFSFLFFTVFKHQWFELKNCGSYAAVYISPEFLREALFSKKSKVFSFWRRKKSQKIALQWLAEVWSPHYQCDDTATSLDRSGSSDLLETYLPLSVDGLEYKFNQRPHEYCRQSQNRSSTNKATLK